MQLLGDIRMKITTTDLRNFNAGKRPSANEEFNKATGLYNRETYLKLRAIKSAKWGLLNRPITMSHVKEWVHYV
jgi:hypothetical protein